MQLFVKPFRSHRITLLTAAAVATAATIAGSTQAAVLDHVNVSIQNTGGLGGAGASTSDMIFAVYGSDGWGWAGGAGAVQGTLGNTKPAANETFKFNIGSAVDNLNATYGVGNWTIANLTLTYNSSYATQNNSRFGQGSGTFDIYWVANDNWAQSRGTTEDRGLNPIYATNSADLLTWSTDQSLLSSESFVIAGTSYVSLSYDLPLDEKLVSDILSTSAVGGTNEAVTLYLMATSDSLGMIIFTGGQSQALPALSFDVVAVPEPASLALLALGTVCALRRRR